MHTYVSKNSNFMKPRLIQPALSRPEDNSSSVHRYDSLGRVVGSNNGPGTTGTPIPNLSHATPKRPSYEKHFLSRLQRQYGNRYVQRMLTAHSRSANMPVQRDETKAAEPGQPQATTQLRLPEFDLSPGSMLGAPSFRRTLQLVPSLTNPLVRGDVSPFRVLPLPLTPNAVSLLQTTPPWLQSPPTQQVPATPSVPGNATVANLGPVRIRLVFEEPSVQLPTALQEAEEGHQNVLTNRPAPQLDTGAMVKGLIKNFLTQTPPGQQILLGLGRMLGPSEQASASGLTIHFNVDLMPAPILEGEPPRIMLNLEGRW